MKKIIKSFKNYNDSIIITIEFIDGINEPFQRVYYISTSAVSRHLNYYNLLQCLNGEKIFCKDAFIFNGNKGIYEIQKNILNSENITIDQIELINGLCKDWKNYV